MYEIEVKVRADHDRVRGRLADLHAEALGSVTQEDTYFDHPARSFAETDEALRVRRETDADGEQRAILTYKGPLVEETSKTRKEVELRLDDPERMGEILRELGFDPVAEVRKRRERYRIEGYTLTLDTVEGLGEFVEVEAEGAAEEIETLREGVFEVLSRMGLDPDEGIRTSYLGLLLDSE